MPQTIRKEKKKISLRQYNPIKIINRKKSHNEALSYALLNGSLTLEAALILPLFLLGSAVILSLFLMMQVQYSVANALDRAVADTALLCRIGENDRKSNKGSILQRVDCGKMSSVSGARKHGWIFMDRY